MPERQLIAFVLGSELKLLSTKRFKQGHVWFCEKVRREPEACPKCACLSTTRYGIAWALVRDEDVLSLAEISVRADLERSCVG